jgi:hypothetical protein
VSDPEFLVSGRNCTRELPFFYLQYLNVYLVSHQRPLRGERLHSVWPSMSSYPEIHRTRRSELRMRRNPLTFGKVALCRRMVNPRLLRFVVTHGVAIFPSLPKHYSMKVPVVAFFVYSSPRTLPALAAVEGWNYTRGWCSGICSASLQGFVVSMYICVVNTR